MAYWVWNLDSSVIMISCRRYDDDQCLVEFHTEFTLEGTLEAWTKNIGLCWKEWKE